MGPFHQTVEQCHGPIDGGNVRLEADVLRDLSVLGRPRSLRHDDPLGKRVGGSLREGRLDGRPYHGDVGECQLSEEHDVYEDLDAGVLTTIGSRERQGVQLLGNVHGHGYRRVPEGLENVGTRYVTEREVDVLGGAVTIEAQFEGVAALQARAFGQRLDDAGEEPLQHHTLLQATDGLIRVLAAKSIHEGSSEGDGIAVAHVRSPRRAMLAARAALGTGPACGRGARVPAQRRR